MPLKTPNPVFRKLTFAVGFTAALLAYGVPAQAQNNRAFALRDNDPLTWFQTAQAYSTLKSEPMADLATAEVWYNAGDMRKALVFATRARGKLPQGGADWQRAGDIVAAAGPVSAQQRR